MLECAFERTVSHTENQDPTKQLAIQRAKNILSAANVTDPQNEVSMPVSETNEKSEFILDHSLFTYYPERGMTVVMKKDDRVVNLTFAENSIFEVIARKANRVVRFKEFTHIWDESISLDNTLRQNIHNLRFKLGDERVGGKFSIIKSIRGVGFMVDLQQEDQFSNQHVYIHSSGLKYFRERNSVVIDGLEIFFSGGENRLFELLVQNKSKVVSYRELGEAWGGEAGLLDEESVRNLLKKHIGRLRSKIKDEKIEGEAEFEMIKAVWGKGYMLFDPIRHNSV